MTIHTNKSFEGVFIDLHKGKSLARGEHIFVKGVVSGIPFQHHGIDMGDGTVIHLAADSGARVTLRDTSGRFSVRRDPWEAFCGGHEPVVVHHAASLTREQTATAAEKQLGRSGYSLLNGNCEHFATECATGSARSDQIDRAEATVSAVASAATKTFWVVSSRIGTRLLVRGATRIHPATLLADGVEVAALAVGCRRGMDTETSKRLARVSGSVAAAGIGGLVGGPAGAAVCLATHASSTAVAEQICKVVRRVLS